MRESLHRYAYACLLFIAAAVLVAWPQRHPRAAIVSRRESPHPELIPTPAPVGTEIEDLFAEPEDLPAPGWRPGGCQAHLPPRVTEQVTYVVIDDAGQRWQLLPSTLHDAERHGARAKPAYLLFEGAQVVQYGVWVPAPAAN